MGVRLNTRGDAHKNILRNAHFLRNCRHAGKFNARIHHNTTHSRFNCFTQFLRSFIVAVYDYPIHRKINCTSYGQFSATRHVETHAMFICQTTNGFIEKCLTCIRNVGVWIARPKRISVGVHTIDQIGLVVDIECRAIFVSELNHINATNKQMIIFNFCSHGQASSQLHSGTVVCLLV